jgi:predicted small lipoprotein YifL
MQRSSLSKPLILVFLAFCAACGKKGDPIPHPRAAPLPMQASLSSPRIIETRLPTQDVEGNGLVGVEQIRVLYVPLGLSRPSADEVFSKGEVVFERRRPDLPGPGQRLSLDLRNLNRPAGWIVIVAVRLGNVVGRPSEPLPWLNPAL